MSEWKITFWRIGAGKPGELHTGGYALFIDGEYDHGDSFCYESDDMQSSLADEFASCRNGTIRPRILTAQPYISREGHHEIRFEVST